MIDPSPSVFQRRCYVDVDVDVDVSSGFCLGIGTPGYLALRELVTGIHIADDPGSAISCFGDFPPKVLETFFDVP